MKHTLKAKIQGPKPDHDQENLTSPTQTKYYQKGPGNFQISDRNLKIEHLRLFSTDQSQDLTDHGPWIRGSKGAAL